MFEDKMRQSRNPKFIIKDSIMTLSEGGVRNNLDPVLANLKEGVWHGHCACAYLYAILLIIQAGLEDVMMPTAIDIDILLQLQEEGCFTSCWIKVHKYFELTYGSMEELINSIPPMCKSKSTCKGCRYTLEDLELKWCTDEFDLDSGNICPLCRIDTEIQ